MRLERHHPTAEIPTASMVDIAFLLILFFMVTTTFSATKGLDLKLPAPEDRAKPDPAQAVFIKIAEDGSVLVDCKPMGLEEILADLEPKLLRDPDKPVILYTAARAPYQAMISVYDVLGSAVGFKIENLAVPTQSEVREYIGIFGQNPFEAQCPG